MIALDIQSFHQALNSVHYTEVLNFLAALVDNPERDPLRYTKLAMLAVNERMINMGLAALAITISSLLEKGKTWI